MLGAARDETIVVISSARASCFLDSVQLIYSILNDFLTLYYQIRIRLYIDASGADEVEVLSSNINTSILLKAERRISTLQDNPVVTNESILQFRHSLGQYCQNFL
jgi:hypothetical protein